MSELILTLPQIVICIIVAMAKVLEISIQSLKTVLMVKGQRVRAALLGFTECVVWGLIISAIITTLGNNLLLLFFYCFGYALGLFIGSTIENKIALGTTNIEIIANEENTEKIIKYLKENNKGFTVFEGKGSKETVNMILIIVSRKESKQLLKEMRELCDNDVFEITSDVSRFTGGYGIKK